MRIRLTTEPDQRVCLESPYDPGFVDLIKDAVPREGREWVPGRKRWLLSPLYIDVFLDLLYDHWPGIQVLDEREHDPSQAVVSPYASMPEDLRAGFAYLYLAPNAPLLVAEASYRALSRYFHPDLPTGDQDIMEKLNDAIITIRRYLTPQPEAIAHGELG